MTASSTTSSAGAPEGVGGPVSDGAALDVERLRRDTPLLATGRVHFNNAGASPQPHSVIEAQRRHLDLEQELGGYEAADAAAESIQSARASLGRCVGARARNIAFTESATAAYAQALSSFDLGPGDKILLSRYDYASNQIMAISLMQRRGVEMIHARDLPGGGVDPGSVEELIKRHRPKLVSLTHIPTSSGLIQDVASVGRICRESGVPLLVDACQSVGQMPVDAEALGCDFLAATGRKFLRGPRGTGFLFVSDRVLERPSFPLHLDMKGADWIAAEEFQLRADARRFEWWESHVAGRLGLGAAADYALEVGLAAGFARARTLADEIRRRAEKCSSVESIDRGAEQGAIVSLAVHGELDASQLSARLRKSGINTSVTDRTSAVLDLEERSGGRTAALRVSPHYFNSEAEIDRFFDAVAQVTESTGARQ